jgi:putative NADPH-quinone reductase
MHLPRVLILQGHPDPAGGHLLHHLAQAYADGARQTGHEVDTLELTRLDIPLLRSAEAWKHEAVPEGLRTAQQALSRADHLLLCFPLWLGDMPALVKAFFEQVLRPGFAFGRDATDPFGQKGLQGRSARVLVTMGMPALLYRTWFRAHSVKALERNMLGFVGYAPVHHTLVGGVEQLGEAGVLRWCRHLNALGRDGA